MQKHKHYIREIIREELENFFAGNSKSQSDFTQKKFLTVDETANYLNYSKQTIYFKVSTNQIPYHKNGKLYFIKEELDSFMDGTWKPSVDSKK